VKWQTKKEFFMKKYGLIALCALSFGFVMAAETIKIMSYNALLLYSDPKEFYHQARKKSFFDMISSEKPSIIGFQQIKEGYASTNLEDTLKPLGYQSFGDARNTTVNSWFQKKMTSREGTKNERNPIFYDTEKLNLIASGNFGINPTGLIFTAALPRVVTWGQFEDKKTKKQFCVYNTQLSSNAWWGLQDGTERIRNKQMSMILDHAAKNTDNLPVIIMNDMDTIDTKEKTSIDLKAWTKLIIKNINENTVSIFVKNAVIEQYKGANIEQYKDANNIKDITDHLALAAEIILQ
jgi:hypothetical protein